MSVLVFLLSFLLQAGEIRSGNGVQDTLSTDIKRILFLRDQRREESDELLTFLRHPEAEVRRHALMAFADIRIKLPLESIASCLNDSEPSVRAAAAFALRQCAERRGTFFLLRRLELEKDMSVREQLQISLGALCDTTDLNSFLTNPSTGVLDSLGPVLVIARCAIRNVRSRSAIPYLESASRSGSGTLRYWVAYALSRIRDSVIVNSLGDQITGLARDTNPETRMSALLAAALLTDSSRFARIVHPARLDADWRVRVNAVRAVASSRWSPGGALLSSLIGAVRDANTHIQLAGIECLSRKSLMVPDQAGDSVRAVFRSLVEKEDAIGEVRGSALRAMVLLERANSFGYLEEIRANPRGIPIPALLEAYGMCPDRKTLPVLFTFHRAKNDIAVELGRLRGLRNAVAWADPHQRGDIVHLLQGYLVSGDIALTTLAAELCADSLVFSVDTTGVIAHAATVALGNLVRVSDVEPIVALCRLISVLRYDRAVPRLKDKLVMSDAEIRRAAATSLKRITGEDVDVMSFEPEYGEYSWTFIDSLNRGCLVECITDRGRVIIEFFPRETPFTVQNIVRLVEKGFYDGLVFHRVVPNFVIQGGDPRGDGWGGPGWTMRTECSLRQFMRGSVGIASAGTDTEGSQLFITHCATPHLDGRYTLCGRVIRGMDVVDRIQSGDTILRVARLPQNAHFR